MPDGAYLYTGKLLENEFEQDVSWDRMSFLTKRIDLGAESGYADFRELSASLVDQPIKLMSNLTLRLMQSIDYEVAAEQRRKNYQQLHHELEKSNLIRLPLEDDAVPMVYPYMTDREGLREHLIQNKIFVARYWPNVLECTMPVDFEYQLAYQMQPLPIDQRYGEKDMEKIISCINE